MVRQAAVVLGLAILAGAPVTLPGADSPPAPPLTAKGVEFFESKIRPVLTQRCYSCHSANAEEVKGGLRLDTRDALRAGGESGAAVVPGNVEESLLVQALRHETFEMPPGDKLPDDVIAAFEQWIEMGAPDPRTGRETGRRIKLSEARSFWSFKLPVLTPPLPVQRADWPRTEIDRYVLARLEAAGLQPVADADRRTLIRRVTFDLTGLPPAPADVERFVTDTDPEAYAELVDRLLDSPQFGERWGRHWLDVARYGESTGKERNVVFPYAWRYRDYVIDSFTRDKPFDRFIREQIAGDLLPSRTPAERNEYLVATGFLAIGTKSLNERNREQYLMDQADEQIDVTTRAFLGITVACARCHDHKFDPITAQDYYSMAGIFRSTEVLAGLKPGNNKTGYVAPYAMLAEPGEKPQHTPEQLARMKELGEEIQAARARLAQNTAVLRQGSAIGSKKKAKTADRREKLVAAQERLAERLPLLEAELKRLRENPAAGNIPAMAVRDAAQPADCRVHIRGELKELGPEVPRGLPFVLAVNRVPRFDTPQSGRLQLAAWIASKENTLTARVFANRVWAHLFGAGLVEPVDNFGALGTPPSHPELLDYLALRFMDQKWSVKQLIRELVHSRTYQLSSAHQPANYAQDPDNRYLWRMNRRRLEAEAIRDAMLMVSGKLELERPHESPAEKLEGTEFGRRVRGQASFDPQTATCRSVYLPLFRGGVPDVLSVFDMADPSLIVNQREVTTVATQALFMMNSPFVMQQAQGTARSLLNVPRLSDEQRVERLFLRALARPPSPTERNKTLAFLAETAGADASEDERLTAWTAVCQTVLATAEFRYLY